MSTTVSRRYKVYDGDKLILSDARASEVQKAIGVNQNTVSKYATGEYTSNGYYKKRWLITFDEETDIGDRNINISERRFVQLYGIQNLVDWENMQKAAQYHREHHPKKVAKKPQRLVMRFYFVPRKSGVKR